MGSRFMAGAVALWLAAIPCVALADDPNDREMRNRAAREADAAEVRRLNREQHAYVSRRDAQYQAGWQAYREAPQRQAEYERAMAEWRRAVRLCESGRHEYCAR